MKIVATHLLKITKTEILYALTPQMIEIDTVIKVHELEDGSYINEYFKNGKMYFETVSKKYFDKWNK